jgi:hypothetical protein
MVHVVVFTGSSPEKCWCVAQVFYRRSGLASSEEGTTIRYHENGRKATEQEYGNGKRHGRCVTWNDSGAMVKEYDEKP